MGHPELLARLAQPADGRIVLLVLDGVGDLRTAAQPQTPLEAATTPTLDALATGGSTGRIVPVAPGITPGSGPGHLALFGYDPREPEADIGRGILEALGADIDVGAGDVAARGNFATADDDGRLTDRRAGRIPTSECRRLCQRLNQGLTGLDLGAEVTVFAGEAHRFVLRLRGDGLSPALDDTDPQRVGVPALPVRALDPRADATASLVARVVERFEATLADEPQANRTLLRGFSTLPALPSLESRYGIRCGAFAGYPLYRGVAAACGMERIPCGKQVDETIAAAAAHWNDFDFFFLHVKQTDMAGEDGNFDFKVEVLEAVDRALPRLLELEPTVIAVTGDHSTPVPMKAHSWHPVPLLISAPGAFVDPIDRFDEVAVTGGHLGTFPARHLLAMLLAHGGRLEKLGA